MTWKAPFLNCAGTLSQSCFISRWYVQAYLCVTFLQHNFSLLRELCLESFESSEFLVEDGDVADVRLLLLEESVRYSGDHQQDQQQGDFFGWQSLDFL